MGYRKPIYFARYLPAISFYLCMANLGPFRKGIENQVSPRRNLIPHTEFSEDEGILSPRNYEGIIIEDGEWIYVPGYAWYRFDRALKRHERLVPTRLPHEFAQLDICKSEVHGNARLLFSLRLECQFQVSHLSHYHQRLAFSVT